MALHRSHLIVSSDLPMSTRGLLSSAPRLCGLGGGCSWGFFAVLQVWPPSRVVSTRASGFSEFKSRSHTVPYWALFHCMFTGHSNQMSFGSVLWRFHAVPQSEPHIA